MIPQHAKNTHAKNKLASNQPLSFLSHKDQKKSTVSIIRTTPNINSIKRYNTQSTVQFDQLGTFGYLTGFNSLSTNSDEKSKKKLYKRNINKSQFQINENDSANTSSWTNIGYNNLLTANFNSKINKTNKNLKKPNNSENKIKAAVKASSLPRNGRNIISIQINSNWGNTFDITMHFIALYDIYNHQISSINPINNILNSDNKDPNFIYIASTPEPSSLAKLEYLLETSYIKDDEKVFVEKFNDQKFTIYLSINQSIEIGSIRIFNPPNKSESAIKDVSIYVNAKLCIQSQIPQSFGANLKLNYQIPSITKLEENNEHLIPNFITYQDKFGILPIKPVKQVKIEIIETYNSNSSSTTRQNYIGVNGFDFYDILGNYISTEKSNDNYIENVNIRGISELINCGILLRQNKVTYKEDDMLFGVMDGIQNPTFTFIFKEPIYLSKIVVWNYNGHGNNLDCGIKKLKLFGDEKLIWYGKINRGNGKLRNMMKNTHSINFFDQVQDVVSAKI